MGIGLTDSFLKGPRLVIADAKTELAFPPLDANCGLLANVEKGLGGFSEDEFRILFSAAGGTNLTACYLYAMVLEPFTYADTTFTTTHGADSFQVTAHALKTGMGPFQASNAGGALPAGLVAYNPTTGAGQYFIVRVDADNFKVANSRAEAYAGAVVNLTGNGTGTHTISDFTQDGPLQTQKVCFATIRQLGIGDGVATKTVTLTDQQGYTEVVPHVKGAIGYAVSSTLSSAVATTVTAYPVRKITI